jgi:flagellar biosynthetic protein FliO
MKAGLEKIMFIALFLSCACGPSALASPQNEIDKMAGSSGTVAGQTQTTQPNQPMPAVDSQDMSDAGMHFPMFRTLGGMGLVICLMIGIYLAAKKIVPQYFGKSVAERKLKIIETLSMGDRRSLSVIEVANNRFLVGNTPHQINLLAALPQPIALVSEPDAVSARPNEKLGNESGSTFRNLFEVEGRRSSQYMGNPLPEDIRTKMRQLRDALER